MNHRLLQACAVLFLAGPLCLVGSAEQIRDVRDVTPEAGSVGTELVIRGEGFGTLRPRVFLVPDGRASPARRVRLRVLDFSDTQITALLTRGHTGTFNVKVVPRGRGEDAIVARSAFRVELPSIVGVDPQETAPRGEVEIAGRFFGTEQGTVRIGGSQATVLSWEDEHIRVQLAQELGDGPQDVEVVNRVGRDADPGAVLILGGGGGDPTQSTVSAQLGLLPFDVRGASVFATRRGAGFTWVATDASTGVVLDVDASNMDLTNLPALTSPDRMEVRDQGTTWSASSDVALRVTRFSNGLVEGTFRGSLRRQAGAAPPDILEVDGTFTVHLE